MEVDMTMTEIPLTPLWVEYGLGFRKSSVGKKYQCNVEVYLNFSGYEIGDCIRVILALYIGGYILRFY